MQTINLVATSDQYTNAVTLIEPQAVQIAYVVANNPVFIQTLARSKAVLEADWSPEFYRAPETNLLSNVAGIRFRSAVPSSPAVIIAQSITREDPIPGAGTPFLSLVNSNGSIDIVAQPGAILAFGYHAANVAGNGGTTFAGGVDLLFAGSPTPLPFTADGSSDYFVDLDVGAATVPAGTELQFWLNLDNGTPMGRAIIVNLTANNWVIPIHSRFPLRAPASGNHAVNIRFAGPVAASVSGGDGLGDDNPPITVAVVQA